MAGFISQGARRAPQPQHAPRSLRHVHLSGSPTLHVPLRQRRKNQEAALAMENASGSKNLQLSSSSTARAPRPSSFGIPSVNVGAGDSIRAPDPESFLSEAELGVNVERLAEWLQEHSSHEANGNGIICLTGAGLSTESGIPDYRGANGSYHKGHKPMLHDQFMGSELMRKRYWARALVGWRVFANRQPNRGHYALTTLEDTGVVGVHDFDCSETEDDLYDDLFMRPSRKRLTTITQNVDGLHQKSSMARVVDLHGAVSRLKCMSCGHRSDRDEFYKRLEEKNADWLTEQERLQKEHDLQTTTSTKDSQLRPDGDAQLIKDNYHNLDVPLCPNCGSLGLVKPDVVFFGDTVPLPRVRMCYNAVEASSAILCIGTSLAVHSAFRFVAKAAKQGKPIGILNVGPTQAEAQHLPNLTKFDSPIGSTLEGAVRALS